MSRLEVPIIKRNRITIKLNSNNERQKKKKETKIKNERLIQNTASRFASLKKNKQDFTRLRDRQIISECDNSCKGKMEKKT